MSLLSTSLPSSSTSPSLSTQQQQASPPTPPPPPLPPPATLLSSVHRQSEHNKHEQELKLESNTPTTVQKSIVIPTTPVTTTANRSVHIISRSNSIQSGNSSPSTPSRPGPLILQAPQPSDILFFNENRFDPATVMQMMGVKHRYSQYTFIITFIRPVFFRNFFLLHFSILLHTKHVKIHVI